MIPSKGRGSNRNEENYCRGPWRSASGLSYVNGTSEMQTPPSFGICPPPPRFADHPPSNYPGQQAVQHLDSGSTVADWRRGVAPSVDSGSTVAESRWGRDMTSSVHSGGTGRSTFKIPPPPAAFSSGHGADDNEEDYCGSGVYSSPAQVPAYCGSVKTASVQQPANYVDQRNAAEQQGFQGFGSQINSQRQPYVSSPKPPRGRGRSAYDDGGCQEPSSTNGGFGGGFGSGFGQGFSNLQPERSQKRESPRGGSKLGGGFKDWLTIGQEMEKLEIAKWADLPAIKRDFYTECPTITALSEEEVAKIRQSKNNITVEDLKLKRSIPRPVQTFQQAFGNYPEVMAEIDKQGFTEPSPIQCQMWPVALSGHDVIGIAQTGTGKTLGFLLPIFIHLDSQEIPKNEKKGPGCLILSPTRELAMQIHSEVKKYRYKKMKSVCLYGGGDRAKQIESCLEGVNIVIATPGRLNDLVLADVVNLRTITFIVLDEADRMLDMGFEPQIKVVLSSVRSDRQTIMTSATWPPDVRRMAESYTKNPFLVVVGSLDLRACSSVTQIIEVVQEEEKRDRLFDFLLNLKPHEKIIVFVGKKSLVDDMSSDLARMGIRCQSLHGDRDQTDRERALNAIRNGEVKILIATDVASRGLDILDITHVFNYDFPRHMEEYVHRVGRTGRAGRSGVSVTFVTRHDWRNAGELIKILEEANQEVPDELKRMADRWAQKLLENPEMANRKAFFKSKSKQPFFYEDHI